MAKKKTPRKKKSTVEKNSGRQRPDSEDGVKIVRAGALCYSLPGQTGLIWELVEKKHSENEWLRFHFMQSSLLGFVFALGYAILIAAAIPIVFFPPYQDATLFLEAFIAWTVLQAGIYTYLGNEARKGNAVLIPLIGTHATHLARAGHPLHKFKI